MKSAIGTARVVDTESKVYDTVRQQARSWCGRMDRILDIHRSRFISRHATRSELNDHKVALGLAIRFTHLLNTLVADAGFNEPDLVVGLRERARQLQAAYDAC